MSPSLGQDTPWEKRLESLEVSSGGRIGLSAFDTGNLRHFHFRSDERFPFCSTFKAVLAAAILNKSTNREDLLNKSITIDKEVVQTSGWSPITSKRIGNSMTVSELCAATLQYSDNPAANLLLKELGGLEEINKFARSIGDNEFRLNRWESDLNSLIPGDIRDTTTPSAMQKTLRTLMLGNALQKKNSKNNFKYGLRATKLERHASEQAFLASGLLQTKLAQETMEQPMILLYFGPQIEHPLFS